MVGSANLITKVYFPRIVAPLAAVLGGVLDLAVASPVLIAMMWYYGIWPSAGLVAVPALLLLALIATSGAGLWLAALNVEYRDVRFVIPFLVQLLLFLTPVIYPASKAAPLLHRFGVPVGVGPQSHRRGRGRNALGTPQAPNHPGALIAASTVSGLSLFAGGALFFRRVERSVADVI